MERKEQENLFIDMIHRNERVIYKVCSFYVSDGMPVNDLYQDVVYNLWVGYAKFRGECAESTWIYRIALNTCISGLRKDKHNPLGNSVSLLNDQLTEPECLTEQIREMYRLIHQLKSLERAIVLLWLEEKPYQEIADITGLTVSNVATKLKRAKEKLKQMSNR